MPEGKMRIEYVSLSTVRRWPRNPKSHVTEDISASMDRFGFTEPPIIDERTGFIAAGHGRFDALEERRKSGGNPPARVEVSGSGDWMVPVVRGISFKDDSEMEAYLVASNALTIAGGWDDEKLIAILSDLAEGAGLEGTGYDVDALEELERLVNNKREEDKANADVQEPAIPEPPKKPKSKLGEVYQLGPHRLMCGDSTNADNVIKLMQGERAVMMATDPPYLVDYTGMDHQVSAANKAKKNVKSPNNKDGGWDAYQDPTSSVDFFAAFIRVALDHALVENPPVYQWHASRRQALVEAAWTKNGLLWHQQIIWVKSRPVMTHSHFMWQHEPCAYGWIEGKPPSKRPPVSGENTTVWPIDNKDHESADRLRRALDDQAAGSVRASDPLPHQPGRVGVRAVPGKLDADHRRSAHRPALLRDGVEPRVRRRRAHALGELRARRWHRSWPGRAVLRGGEEVATAPFGVRRARRPASRRRVAPQQLPSETTPRSRWARRPDTRSNARALPPALR